MLFICEEIYRINVYFSDLSLEICPRKLMVLYLHKESWKNFRSSVDQKREIEVIVNKQ